MRKKMMGGGMMQRPMYKDGGKIMKAAKAAAKKGKDKKAFDRMKNSRPNKKSGSSAVDVFKSYGKYDGKPIELKDGGKSKKSESKIISISVGVGKAKDYPGIKKIMEMNKKGKKKFSDGGSALKDIPAGKKFDGLRKLPKEVRNKMKYKKDGGKI